MRRKTGSNWRQRCEGIMENFWSMLGNPTFLVCLLVGACVVFKFSFEQFGKPSVSQDENDPWKFVPPRNLTPWRQYLIGFFVYSGSLMLIFLAISIVGPKPFVLIANAAGVPVGEFDTKLTDFSIFPVFVALFLANFYPTLHVPAWLDFEIVIRRLAHRIAYIPKNMDLIFNYMRFSDFDLSQEKLDDAWNAIGLRRPVLDAPDCSSIRPLLDRTMLLYVRALNLASDGQVENSREVREDLSVDVFRQYRDQIQNIEVSL